MVSVRRSGKRFLKENLRPEEVLACSLTDILPALLEEELFLLMKLETGIYFERGEVERLIDFFLLLDCYEDDV